MKFVNPQSPINLSDIIDAELAIGFTLPGPVRDLYLLSNGGSPESYVFQNEDLHTTIAEFLPLKSDRVETALESYRNLVVSKMLVPLSFFPFAADSGRDYFFVDSSTPEGKVHFYKSDSHFSKGLLDLNLGFEEFWAALKNEE